jgi:hypothetical protein
MNGITKACLTILKRAHQVRKMKLQDLNQGLKLQPQVFQILTTRLKL